MGWLPWDVDWGSLIDKAIGGMGIIIAGVILAVVGILILRGTVSAPKGLGVLLLLIGAGILLIPSGIYGFELALVGMVGIASIDMHSRSRREV